MIDLGSDREVLAATIWGQARAGDLAARQRTASVALNRAAYAKTHDNRPEFGDGSVRMACRAPDQFPCWTPGDPSRMPMLKLNFASPDAALTECLAIADQALAGALPDSTGGSFDP